MYWLVGIFTICLMFYTWFYYKIDFRIIFIFKILLSFLFIIIGVFSLLYNKQYVENYVVFVITGLICGFFGDIILGYRSLYKTIKKSKRTYYLIIGIILFMIGHLFYFIALLNNEYSTIIRYFLIALILTIIFIIISYIVNMDFKGVKFVIYLYIFISCLLLVTSFLKYINNTNKANLIIFLGLFSFVLSDFILSFIYFKDIIHKNKVVLKKINIISYYIGQVLMAISIMFLK